MVKFAVPVDDDPVSPLQHDHLVPLIADADTVGEEILTQLRS